MRVNVPATVPLPVMLPDQVCVPEVLADSRTVFRAPASYTGEDVVEISCHGGLAVVQAPAEATALMKEIFIARKALEACLISSALFVLVTMIAGGICARSGPGIASGRL